MFRATEGLLARVNTRSYHAPYALTTNIQPYGDLFHMIRTLHVHIVTSRWRIRDRMKLYPSHQIGVRRFGRSFMNDLGSGLKVLSLLDG